MVIVITCEDWKDHKRKWLGKTTWVSHGIDSETLKPVILGDETLEWYIDSNLCKFDTELNEWYLV